MLSPSANLQPGSPLGVDLKVVEALLPGGVNVNSTCKPDEVGNEKRVAQRQSAARKTIMTRGACHGVSLQTAYQR